MKPVAAHGWALGLLGLALLASALEAQLPAPAAAQVTNLQRQYDAELAAYQQALAAARTPEERKRALARHPRGDVYARRFLELARALGRADAGAEALAWVVLHPVEPATRAQAIDLLLRDHLDNIRVGRLCTQVFRSLDPSSERLLRRALEGSKEPGVQARAGMSLALERRFRLGLLQQLKDEPGSAEALEQVWGKPAVASLRGQSANNLKAEAEKLLEQVAARHGKLPHPQFGDLGKMARTHLTALREPVRIGAVVPETKGTGADGKALALSDFRGKVVLLDFWGDSFPPCREQYAAQRKLVARLAARPFALVGVNGDASPAALARVRAAQGMTWPSFWDGGGTGGPLATRWDVELWPTLFLIDHTGVVRHRFVGWPETKVLDGLLDKYLAAGRGG